MSNELVGWAALRDSQEDISWPLSSTMVESAGMGQTQRPNLAEYETSKVPSPLQWIQCDC